jgi:hypothetical protein
VWIDPSPGLSEEMTFAAAGDPGRMGLRRHHKITRLPETSVGHTATYTG